MWTIVGLGNPGKEYEHTRHNIAWIVLRALISEQNLPSLVASSAFSSLTTEAVLFGQEVRIMLPTTYMNNSGSAVKKVISNELNTLVVLHDDIDLPFGTVRVAVDRGAGGHNGVRSIIAALGSAAFVRIRIGIGKKNIFGIMRRPKGDGLSNFVLAELSKKEVEGLPEITKKVERALELVLDRGAEGAMQEMNV